MADARRIIDANLNRGREALRVMEDVARFVLDDAELAARIKSARHGLRAIADRAGLDPVGLAAWRDTPGDVGTGFTGPGERERESIAAVAVAAGKRAGEALRVLEETTKLLPPQPPCFLSKAPSAHPTREVAQDSQGDQGAQGAHSIAKTLRYEVYEIERRLVLALGTGFARQWRLCVLITESLCTHAPWERVAEGAVEGGAEALQLREKGLSDRELLDRSRRLVAIARGARRGGGGERPVSVIVNDRPDIALASGADGVHVGQTDIPVGEVRRIAGGSLLVGVSTANLTQALRAAADGADYCGCGPMFPSATKEKPTIAGPGYLREYLREPRTARLPHLAIGGITADRVHELRTAGCRGLGVSSAVCGAPDPSLACREIASGLERGTP